MALAYTRLHHELDVLSDVLPESSGAQAAKRAAAAELDTLARRCWGDGVTAVVFGSTECGLALRGAGLDVVVAGVADVPSPDNDNGSGYQQESAALVVQQLQAFERCRIFSLLKTQVLRPCRNGPTRRTFDWEPR